jgi:hypothetical protein
MKKIIKTAISSYMLLSAISLLSVSIMAFADPQAVMDLVNVQLNNTDAISSIRGVYGGVGLTLFLTIIYLLLKDPEKGLIFMMLLWGFYALSRIITIFKDGELGAFGTQWLIIESVLFVIAVSLFRLRRVGGRS